MLPLAAVAECSLRLRCMCLQQIVACAATPSNVPLPPYRPDGGTGRRAGLNFAFRMLFGVLRAEGTLPLLIAREVPLKPTESALNLRVARQETAGVELVKFGERFDGDIGANTEPSPRPLGSGKV